MERFCWSERSALYWFAMPVYLYAILTWTTRDREELIDPECSKFLDRFLRKTARRHGADVLAAGVV